MYVIIYQKTETYWPSKNSRNPSTRTVRKVFSGWNVFHQDQSEWSHGHRLDPEFKKYADKESAKEDFDKMQRIGGKSMLLYSPHLGDSDFSIEVVALQDANPSEDHSLGQRLELAERNRFSGSTYSDGDETPFTR